MVTQSDSSDYLVILKIDAQTFFLKKKIDTHDIGRCLFWYLSVIEWIVCEVKSKSWCSVSTNLATILPDNMLKGNEDYENQALYIWSPKTMIMPKIFFKKWETTDRQQDVRKG
jgi:hypothetical protein